MDLADALATYRQTLRSLGSSPTVADIAGAGTTAGAVRGWWGEGARLPSTPSQRIRLVAAVGAAHGEERAKAFEVSMAVLEGARADRRREPSGAAPRDAPDTQLTTRARLRLELDASCVWGFAQRPVRHADLPWNELHPPQYSSLTGGNLPRYVERDVDATLDARLHLAFSSPEWRDRLVVIVSPPKSGKTRSLLEALSRAAPTKSRLIWTDRPGSGPSPSSQPPRVRA
jgi:hypothetical protein